MSEIAQSRERFEKWATDRGFTQNTIDFKNDRGRYCFAPLSDSWDVWQAAERDTRERVAQRIAKADELIAALLLHRRSGSKATSQRVYKLVGEYERIRGKE